MALNNFTGIAMPKFNYARSNLKRRVAAEQHFYTSRSTSEPEPAAFPKMPFGRYRGLTIPRLFFANINYLLYLDDEDVIYTERKYLRKLAQQVDKIIHLASHVRPPRSQSCKREFAIIVDRTGNVTRLDCVHCGTRPTMKAGERLHARRKTLNILSFDRFPDPDRSRLHVVASLQKIFLDDVTGDFERKCENFFMDKNHFDVLAPFVLGARGY